MIKQQRSSGGFLATLGGGVAVVGIALAVGWGAFNWLGKPFTTERVDRSAPPVLNQMRDLAEYRAASADFEVTLDIEDDVKWLPSFIAGERVMFVGVGSVDAYVDFSGIDRDAVRVSLDGTKVTVTLPHARMADAVVDPKLSHVANRDRGLVNRVSGMFSDNPTSEAELYVQAGDKMQAAASASQLISKAEANTTKMLTSLLSQAGFEKVVVEFTGSPAAAG